MSDRTVGDLRSRLRRHAVRAVLLHTAAAAKAGLNASDAQCLRLLAIDGPMTPGGLADAMSLTTGGSITAVIDRLEKAGLARRVPDPDDRRRVLVEPVAAEVARLEGYFGPATDDAWAALGRYSDDELRLLVRFFDDVEAIVPDVIRRMRALP